MENCCQSLVKYLLSIFNLLFAVIGLTYMGLGSYVYSQIQSDPEVVVASFAFIFLIITGIVIFVISCLGFLGSLLENKCMLYTYSAFLLVTLLAEVFIGIFVYVMVPQIIKDIMKTEMTYYGKPGYENITMKWDNLQQNSTCCGVVNFQDWNVLNNGTLPSSCCDTAPCDIANVYIEGCFEALEKQNTVIMDGAIAAIGIAVLKLTIIICSYWIARKSNQERTEGYASF